MPLVLHFFAVSDLGGSELGAAAYIRHQGRFEHRALFMGPPGPAAELFAGAGHAVESLGAAGPAAAALRIGPRLAAVRPDLVHAYGLRPSLLVRLLPRRPALVQAVHSVDLHRPGWQAALDRATARRVDRYITNSEAGASFLAAARGVEPGRIRIVPNGIDVEAFAAAASRRAGARAALGLEASLPAVVTVANLRAPKGLDVLAEAASRLAAAPRPPFVWLVAGEGPLAADLAADLARRGLGGTVRLLGFRRDIPDLLAAADLFCLTSRREGVPVSILEAMAAGKAVVATDVGGTRELVAHGTTGLLVPPGDSPALAAAIASLLDDPARRAALGAAAQARALAHHSIEGSAAAIAAIYDELLAARRIGAP